MIDGITILDTTNVWICDSVLFDIFIIIAFVGAILLFLSLVGEDDAAIIISLFIAVIVFCILSSIVYKTNGKTVHEYKVTISDTVSFNDVYEKYEIIEQEGDLYTIRERIAKDS